MLMLKAVTCDGFLQFFCSFLTHLTRTGVPSTPTASSSGFLHQNMLAPWSGKLSAECRMQNAELRCVGKGYFFAVVFNFNCMYGVVNL